MNEHETNVAVFVAASIAFVGFVTYAAMAETRIKALEKTVERKKAVAETHKRHFNHALKYIPTELMPGLLQDMRTDIKFAKIVINNEM